MTEAVRYEPSPSDAEVDQLLHPGRFYARPTDVVADELLTIDERRAILSSWASDACAVESNPPLRRPPLASAPVTFDEIMDALVQLDRMKRLNTIPSGKRIGGRATFAPRSTRVHPSATKREGGASPTLSLLSRVPL
jgi:hypothetical protein